ncbi:peptidoglycan-binding domain-containing protein [Streptomyces cyanogenus]|uniref:peptidoglycan-binding domain-containing protein n=1 Tax=Streptomyces cyanogenus TaxID=80860 RepID=UPI001FB73825|nr:peptidoglycan-binding domain-containing protein [Streptomyces cyanogenus]
MVQPLWSHGARQEAGKQPTASDARPRRNEPSAPRPGLGPVRASVRRGAGPSPDASWTADPGPSALRTAPLDAPPREAPARPDTVRLPLPKASPEHRRFTDRRHARVAGFFGLGAVSGLLLASSLLTNQHSEPAAPPAAQEQPERPLPDDTSLPEIPGTGVLREGDSGHGVYELQVRLLQIPGLYDGGAIDGRYGTEVRQAVARFQKRFGIRGDETGVYGDNTRYALMLRTK